MSDAGGRKLRPGFTTGAAAAAAARAALTCLVSGRPVGRVPVRFLTGETTSIAILETRRFDDSRAESLVVKDAGDDPDVTHKARIGARVFIEASDSGPEVLITGGHGVGMVTKPGLEVPPGHPAINPGPVRMITEAVTTVLENHPGFAAFRVHVEVFVPDGERLAQKTLNARLGIVGGISILGTTGIVRPMSHDAYIATIRSGISVASAAGIDTLVFTTGRRSERYAMAMFDRLPPEAFIQIGDFFQASLEAAESAPGIGRIILTVFFGKAVKMAMGFGHTHAARSELTVRTLADWAREITGNSRLEVAIAGANTARHAFELIHPDYPDLTAAVGRKIVAAAVGFCPGTQQLETVIFDFNGIPVFDSTSGTRTAGQVPDSGQPGLNPA